MVSVLMRSGRKSRVMLSALKPGSSGTSGAIKSLAGASNMRGNLGT